MRKKRVDRKEVHPASRLCNDVSATQHQTEAENRMHLKTILNRVENFKSFVYGSVRWLEEFPEPAVEVDIRPRANGQAHCSGCGCRRPGYDTLAARRFEFIPMWGIKVFFRYAPRRVNCRSCGVRVE